MPAGLCSQRSKHMAQSTNRTGCSGVHGLETRCRDLAPTTDNHFMAEPLPIVFMHYGNSNYLPFTIGQAKLMSMGSPIVLIGDPTNNVLPFVTHVDMNRYSRQAVEFQ